MRARAHPISWAMWSTVAACAAAPVDRPDRAPAMHEALFAWFHCDECIDGELAAVIAFRDGIVPTLAATLQHGLAPAQREALRLGLETTHAALAEHDPAPPEREPWIARRLAAHDARYRIRAAIALLRIDTPSARAALTAAAAGDLPTDVRDRVARLRAGPR